MNELEMTRMVEKMSHRVKEINKFVGAMYRLVIAMNERVDKLERGKNDKSTV